jgi:hypothetical protein
MDRFLALTLEPLKEVLSQFLEFSPKLLAMLIVILVGIVAARLVRKILLKVLKATHFDAWSDRMGLTSMMRKGDFWAKPSDAVASFLFWLLIMVSLLAGFSALQVRVIDHLIDQLLAYLPRVLSAVLVLVFGYVGTGLIGRGVLISMVNSGYRFARQIARMIRLLLIVLIIAMALEQLQVAPGVVVAAFSIVFGGIVLALAISFGAAGIDAARKMIEQQSEREQERERDIEHV